VRFSEVKQGRKFSGDVLEQREEILKLPQNFDQAGIFYGPIFRENVEMLRETKQECGYREGASISVGLAQTINQTPRNISLPIPDENKRRPEVRMRGGN
jgi:hypothetical protein